MPRQQYQRISTGSPDAAAAVLSEASVAPVAASVDPGASVPASVVAVVLPPARRRH